MKQRLAWGTRFKNNGIEKSSTVIEQRFGLVYGGRRKRLIRRDFRLRDECSLSNSFINKLKI